MRKTPLVVLAIASLMPAALSAQGNLSTQGFGYPQGQLSARSLAFGGGFGEVDPSSALNPASLGRLTTRTVVFQIEPEFRTLTSGTATDQTTTARYPLVNIGVPFGERWVIGASASSLLDRSWATSATRTETIGGQPVETTLRESSNGAMNDLRLAGTWTNRSWLSVGMGIHAVTGRNVVTSAELFADSAFDSFTSSRVLSYTGSAVSIGTHLASQATHTVVGLAYRKGFGLRARSNDTTLAKGNVPDRFGISVGFTGIQGTTLAARVSRDAWSSMTSMLVTPGEEAHDSWDIGGGGEFAGPRFLGQTFLLRAGARARTLPFEAATKTVKEKSVSLGTGTAFGGGRISVDVTGSRQWRDAELPSVKERAWTLSVSLTARP